MPQNDSQPLTEQDLAHLRHAIDLAAKARAHGAHPFGALIVDADGKILVTARNNAIPPKGDPTQHAERLACSLVGRQFSPAQLATATLFTSTEPCAMCAGAIYWTGIGRVVYALSATSLHSLTGSDPQTPTLDLPCRELFAKGSRPTRVQGPYLEEEAAQVHQGFWTALISGEEESGSNLRLHPAVDLTPIVDQPKGTSIAFAFYSLQWTSSRTAPPIQAHDECPAKAFHPRRRCQI